MMMQMFMAQQQQQQTMMNESMTSMSQQMPNINQMDATKRMLSHTGASGSNQA